MTLNTTQHSTIESNKLENIMSYCYGTEHYYKIPQYSFNYTDGVKTFCEKVDSVSKNWSDKMSITLRKEKQFGELFFCVKQWNTAKQGGSHRWADVGIVWQEALTGRKKILK